jgi:hypothetical protein
VSDFLYEHKTTTEDIGHGSSYWRRVTSIDPQVTIYLNGLQAVGIDCRGVIYDALRKPAHKPSSKGETPEHFEKRVLNAIAADPDRYYQRSNPVRLSAERRESDMDVWQTAQQIRESRRLGIWPRNPDACMQWNRACDYLPVCTGEADITDPFLYRRGDRVHDELAPPRPETIDGREVLTQSSIRCFRSCARKYQFRYVMGLKTLKKPEPLRAGSSIHAALNEWMRTNGDLKAALSKLDADDLYKNARERAMIIGYHVRWDRPPKVVAVEKEWSSDLVNPETGAASKTFKLAGKADMIVEMTDEQAAEQRVPSLAGVLQDSLAQRGND